jgi:hypothetical protein
LNTVFDLEIVRNNRYTYPAVQRLKEATENYDSKSKQSFITLLKAVKEALPYIEKWRLSFDIIRTSVDSLAKCHHLPKIDWNSLLSHSQASPNFQFSALNNQSGPNAQEDLIVWIAAHTGKPYTQLDHAELTQALVNHREQHGFSQKLSTHLEKDPDFLFNLMMKSQKNFHKIVNSRLILFLTDEQLAKAIVKYASSLVNKQEEPMQQVQSLMHTLNQILAKGRSINVLMRNHAASAVLNNSVFFQMYQSEEYQNQVPLMNYAATMENRSSPYAS